MSAVSLRVLALGYAVLASGCVSVYKPPTYLQPHAVLKLRRVYQVAAGTRLEESLSLEGSRAFSSLVPSEAALTPRTDALLVHPMPAHMNLASGFSHDEVRPVQEAYTVQIPYTASESYSCGYGRNYQTCMRTVTRYRSETRYRTVMRSVQVSDGSCAQGIWLAPLDGHTYLLELTYHNAGACTLLCYEQIPNGAQEFTHAPCPIVNVVPARP